MDIAVIPARGGSKRLPRKNIRSFSGRPLMTWAIQTAIESALFSRVIVSTDDMEIASIASAYGAEVPYARAPSLANDDTPLISVVGDMSRSMISHGLEVDLVCCILPAAVLITAEDLENSRALLMGSSSLYSASILRFGHPIQRAFELDDNKHVRFIDASSAASRSQDLATRWHDAGQFYWGRVSSWLRETPILENSIGYEVPSWRAVDIDNEDDWQLAERLHKTR